jgi:HEAT repeat protein
VEPLLLALSREQPDVQAEAARALGRCNDARALPRLRALLPDAPAQVRIAAIEALRELGDEQLGDVLVDVLGADDSEVVKAALSALAEAGGARGLSRVAIALEHRAWDVRRLAAELLTGTRDPMLIELVAQRLEREQDSLVREALEVTLAGARQGAR